ncbi:DNA helicase [Intrasporangium oryzae NRRL B-24470]|uniref:DNA 3'-5' helicase n=1 Tax=Intrasporangium oryzae NRRL B-24470 TaxID=1386089 RepID=W9G2S6_9MICO|nr:ATP-dependent DNA helicase [Intrasporangium oryzae]EWT00305.1 DNA helicase [Intrasporangium oryzae NRRL B-24470]
MSPRYSALDIARALDKPEPTPEQQAVIESGPRPLLVVAGAGSGKTETMAARVVWLVANGLVEPDQVLGLTFTRKAAAELSQRITQRLRALVRAGLWTPPADDGTGAEVLGGTPTVSTYHAYAGRLVREHALRVGIEPEFRMLTEAGAWQLAAEAVSRYDGPMDEVTKAESTVIDAVMSLAGEMAEHVRTPDEVLAHLDEVIGRIEALPDGEGRGSLTGVRDALAVLRERRAVLPIVKRYLDLKREKESLDFADQMAVAARLSGSVAHVGEVERARFRAVLLDEFQDTSEAQLSLLRSLFHGGSEPVALTAVGDPNQSIYGWRGASATTLARFPAELADETGPAAVLPLSTSWRNDALILDAANITAAPLAAAHVEPLTARPGAGGGSIAVARLASIEDEAAHVADWVASGWRSPSGRRTGRTAAVLCRRRSHFPFVIDALRARGLPVEVVGLGGLLMTPEIGDLVATLWVVQDPSRGDQLMRLLTGPVARLGTADLDGLWAWAKELHARPWRVGRAPAVQPMLALDTGRAEPERVQGAVALLEPDDDAGGSADAAERHTADLAADSADTATLVEALGELPRPGWVGHGGVTISDGALSRLSALSDVLAGLRRMTALPLVDLVSEAERAVGLDIEVLSRPEHTASTARVHLDAFADVAARFAMSSDRPTLAGFLGWLEAAREQERGLDAGHVETDADAVQVLTIHAAKGLEWDLVAVPALVESVFPDHKATTVGLVDGEWSCTGQPKDFGWLTGIDSVPYDLRGDRDGLPHLDWRGAPDRKALGRAVDDFALDGGAHAIAEERRLAYVAFTRARSAMLLSTHFWGATKKGLSVESRFLREIRLALGARLVTTTWAPDPEPVTDDKGRPVAPDNPFLAHAVAAEFPYDPMGARRVELARVVDRLVELGTSADLSVAVGDPRHDDLRLLLAEEAGRRGRGDVVVDVPRHLSASAVVSFARDPEAFAMTLRRPMPGPPAVAARQGTAFHAWIEQHYARAAIVDVFDLPGSADEEAASDVSLARLKELFLQSEWVDRMPEEIEMSIETIIDGIAVRGRIDAVFPRADGGWTVVDWKTGVRPSGREAEVRAVQLGAYALAYARLRGVDPSRVDAAFYYAAEGVTVRPEVPDEATLSGLLQTLPV